MRPIPEFPLGMGMTIVISKEKSSSVEKWLNERLPGTRRVGYVHDKRREVTHADSEIVFSHY